ncbi:MAG TPA: prenyltransferase/squalene oxidase repeat-containing protein [Gemmataceae bacterium]|jgi:geranylgeranyl transferase type-2 subunit beta|nr:prenyltransferase/squalene oxidase repeat-containing protein [Gemmataceae bacterium]
MSMMIRLKRGFAVVLLLPAAAAWLLVGASGASGRDADKPAAAADVLAGVRTFFRKTARDDGSFRPGTDPAHEGISDSAYSDLAPVTYAVILHKTFGWKLPHELKTREFLRSRQRKDGAFYNVGGTVDPESAQGRVYNTTQGLVALHALGLRPRYDPLPVFALVLKADYRQLPAYSTSFFPLAYQANGQRLPPAPDRKLRATMTQADDGYLNDHIAATFHAVHYYRLLGEKTPKSEAILRRTLRDQKPDGSWLLNPPARDRHATFDAVFVLRQLGSDRPACRRAIARAAAWALRCRNADGGFGHFPGSVSDADAVYFQVGTLVMAGVLRPVKLPRADARLLGWGHVFPLPQ